MEKILLKFDEAEYISDKRKLGWAITSCQKLIDGINAICSYKVDNSGFKDILQSRGEYVAKCIEKALNAELQQARIYLNQYPQRSRKG